MYTDGFADQFGGPMNKKFKNKALLKLLFDNHLYAMEYQKQILRKNFDEWKENNFQVDDVLLPGLRFT